MLRSIAACVASLIVVVALPACDGSGSGTVQPAATTAPVTLRLSIEGMHCSGCVDAITEKVTAIDGVTGCTVSLDDKRAEIQVKDLGLAPAIEEAITKLGYKVAKPA